MRQWMSLREGGGVPTGELPCRDAGLAHNKRSHRPSRGHILALFECSRLLGEGRRRWGIHTAKDSWGVGCHNIVVDANVLGVIHGQGRIHCKESVKGGDLEIRHATGRGRDEGGRKRQSRTRVSHTRGNYGHPKKTFKHGTNIIYLNHMDKGFSN